MKNQRLKIKLDFNTHALDAMRYWALRFVCNSGKIRAERENVTNVYENHKLIIYMRNFEYFGLWVDARFLDKAREAFHGQSHLIVDSPIDGAMFLKIAVKDIQISNNYNANK